MSRTWIRVWAPSGDRIVFERQTGFWDDLFIIDLDGGRAQPFVVSELDEGEARWSPDGEWIAYRGNDGSDGSDVLVERVDNSEGHVVAAQEENTVNVYPAWSPDGANIALIIWWEHADIAVASACCSNGTDHDYVTHDRQWKEGLDWSPDGSCLVYGGVGIGHHIYSIPSAGGTPKRIVRGHDSARLGSWSPTASQIVFFGNAAESWDLYVVDADGTDMRRLTKTPDVHEITPDWWGPPGVEKVTPPCGQPTPSPSPLPSG